MISRTLTIIGFLLILVVNSFNAQSLLLLQVGDTSDPALGNAFDKNLNRIENLFSEISKNLKYDFLKITKRGQDVNNDNVLEAVSNLSTDSNTIIVFYYTGHGINTGNGTPWPSLLIKNSKKDTLLNLFDVHQLILAKKPKLLITIGDCCNHFMPNSKEASFLQSNGDLKDVSKNNSNVCTPEIFDTKGSIMMTASTAGQYAFTSMDLGGIFTITIDEVLNNHITEEKSYNNWNTLLQHIREKSIQYAKELGVDQTPQYQVNFQ